MGRGAKPGKAKGEAKRPVARGARKSNSSRVHDLEKRLAEAQKREIDALDRQTATGEILRVISSSPTDIQPVFDTIVPNAVTLCGARMGAVYRYDGELLHLIAHHNYPPAVLEVLQQMHPRPPQPDQASGRAILTRAVAQIEDMLADPVYPREIAIAGGWRSIIGVPMLRDSTPIGAIVITRSEAGPFSDGHVELLKTFADQAVIAIENVRLFKELQEKNGTLTEALEQQTATSEILRVISRSPTDSQPVFDAIARNAVALCGGIAAVVLRFDGEMLHVAGHHAMSPQGVERNEQSYPRRPGRDYPPGRALLDRSVVHVPDLQAATEFAASTARQRGAGSQLAVPLLHDGQAIGVIGLARDAVGPFSPQQIAVLQTFADQAVIAIENVRLFTELREKNRALTEAHGQVTEALDQQTATSEILRAIAHAQTDVQPVFDTILQSAVRLCDGLFSALFQFDGELIHHVAQHNFSPEALDEMHRIFPTRPTRGLLPGRAILDRSVVHIPDVLELDPEFRVQAVARTLGIRSGVWVPMLREGTPIGVITVTRAEPGPFSDSEIELLKTFADQAVIAVENVRLFKELEARNRDLTDALARQTATAEVLRVISRSQTDTRPVFAAIMDCAVRLCAADLGSIFAVEAGQLVPIELWPSSPEAWAVLRDVYPRPADKTSLTGRAVVEASVVHVPDIEDPNAPPVLRSVPRRLGFRSQLSVPILRGGQPIGVLSLTRRVPGPFSDPQIELVQTFADQAVIAIENARLLGELQARTAELTQSVSQLTALGEVGRAVGSTLDLETVLTTIVSRAVDLSGLDGGVVFEYDEDTEEFVQRAATETGGRLAEARRTTRVRKGEGALGRTAITLEPVQVPDITVPGAYESRLRRNLIESGIRAILVVPMVREGQLIGCLGVTRNHPGEFPAETIALLRTFATQSALAIQNARLFHELADKGRQLEAASRHKSEFLANMSHELRTPLNAVIGFSEVLLQRMFGALNDKQDEYLKDIYASGQHLLSLINDILDLSKVEAGRMELASAPFHLPTVLENAVTLVKERAARHGITLELDLDPRLGELVGDERKVKQVLLNLLSNAVKFTPEGGRITVKAGRTDEAVEIAVSDTGIGIAPEDQAAIFEEFRQVGTDDARKLEGTGLGLTLAKKFIELHGGRIWVESELGRGSTFTFTLPVS